MEVGQSEHELAVTAWGQCAARGGRVEIVEAFERAFTALWRRSLLTLGEVTLKPIVERVLAAAADEHPALATLVVTESGLRCQPLRTASGLDEDHVSVAVRFVLVEMLTVLGNLTAEILTPALHDELSNCHSLACSSPASHGRTKAR